MNAIQILKILAISGTVRFGNVPLRVNNSLQILTTRGLAEVSIVNGFRSYTLTPRGQAMTQAWVKRQMVPDVVELPTYSEGVHIRWTDRGYSTKAYPVFSRTGRILKVNIGTYSDAPLLYSISIDDDRLKAA